MGRACPFLPESALNINQTETLEWVWTNTATYSFTRGIHSAILLLGTEVKESCGYSGCGCDRLRADIRDYVYISAAEGTRLPTIRRICMR